LYANNLTIAQGPTYILQYTICCDMQYDIYGK